jgi:regulator of protease activity HflC (stomatin/prohibitin superfamily)
MEPGAIICIVASIVIALTVILLLVSMDSLEPLQAGITLNKFTKKTGSDIYTSGRYLIGPFMTFLIYPTNLVTVEFSDQPKAAGTPLQTRTAEGLSLVLHLSFQYQVNTTEIPKLYNLANTNYHSTYVRIARDIILKIAGEFNATSYWTIRQEIGNEMKLALDKSLKVAFANCPFLQILKIDLPQSYEDSIVNTQVEVQKTNMKKFEQQATLIRQNISVIQSEAYQQITIVNATGHADAYQIQQNAIVNIQNF